MRKISIIVTILLSMSILGCATTSENDINSNDPLEAFNRASYRFNSTLDKAVIRPVGKGYDTVFPKPVKTGVSNFFANLDEIPTIFNDVLQGKFSDAVNDTGRLLINTSLGLGGFIDVATDLGLEQHDEDFGQTLAVWGIETGPYLVIPFLGPSTLRDTLARPVDRHYSPKRNVDHIRTRNTIYALELIDLRYRLLVLDSQLEDALDEYSFVRDAFLMRREYKVYDGDPPENDDFYDDDCFDDDDEQCDDDEIID